MSILWLKVDERTVLTAFFLSQSWVTPKRLTLKSICLLTRCHRPSLLKAACLFIVDIGLNFSCYLFSLSLYLQPSLYSKMEKADILDLTVNYLKSVKCEQGYLRDANSLARYRNGYNDCAGEMTRYLMTENGLDYHSRTRLLTQVASHCQNANLRTTADLGARSVAQPPLFIRPVAAPIVTSGPACPTLSSSVPIFPATYAPVNNKHQSSYPSPVSSGPGNQMSHMTANYCQYVMTSPVVNTLGTISGSAANLWRPWWEGKLDDKNQTYWKGWRQWMQLQSNILNLVPSVTSENFFNTENCN